ncbi:MAG: hypothetical protein ACRD0L_16495 [Acidimicrobiales bacterium]
MARLILDAGVLIAGARGRVDVGALADTDDVTIAAVAVAEYLVGTLLDPDPGRAAATARAAGRTVLTTDERARSGELPGVAVRTIHS